MQWIRSLAYNLLMMASVPPFVLVGLFTFPLPRIMRYRYISLWGRGQMHVLAWLVGLRHKVHHRERLPKGPAIIFSKHQSAWETFAFQKIFPPQVWVLKRELLWVPFFGWGLALTNPIAIDRGSGRRAVQQIVQQGRERLGWGRWIVVFPEGTRVAPRHHRRFGIGGAALAAETGYPVVPVAHNAGSFWPRRGFFKRAGTIDVVIGPMIHTQGKTAEEINRIAEEWIGQEMRRLEGDPLP